MSAQASKVLKSCLVVGVPVALFIATQLLRQQSAGVGFPLGWDQPYHVFEVNNIVSRGFFSYIQMHGVDLYYYFYFLIAAIGSPLSDNKLGLMVFEIMAGVVYTALISKISYDLNRSYAAALIAGIVSIMSVNFVRLMILPRQLFVLSIGILILLNIKHLSQSFGFRNPTSLIYVFLFSLVFWWHAATGVVILLVLLFYSVLQRKKLVIYYMLFSTLLGMIPTILLLLNSINKYVPSGPSTPVTLSLYLFASEFSKWLGGNPILFILTIVGFLILGIRAYKVRSDTLPLLIFLWGFSILLLFCLACFSHSIVADWFFYVDRALLIFPTAISLSQGFFFIYASITKNVSKDYA